MPQLITAPARIPVPGGKTIDEYVGRVNTEATGVSVAMMVAPPGWSELAQTPEFDEITLVLRGAVRVDHDAGAVDVLAGQALWTKAGESIRYSVPADAGETQYVAICLPAFSPDLVHRAEE